MVIVLSEHVLHRIVRVHARLRIANGPTFMTQHHAADLRSCSTKRKANQDQQPASKFCCYPIGRYAPAKQGHLQKAEAAATSRTITAKQPDAHIFRYYTSDRGEIEKTINGETHSHRGQSLIRRAKQLDAHLLFYVIRPSEDLNSTFA